jgi:hypothetical protein
MPSFRLPAEHFVAALSWLAIGAVGLVLVAPLLAAGGFLAPRVVAVTHAFTLGLVTTAIFGALYQIFPVALGVAPRSERVAHLTFWILQAGIVVLIAGAWWWRPILLAAGWCLLVLAVGGFSWNVLPARRRASRGRLIGLYVSGGHMGLGLAMFIVAARIGEMLGWWQVDRLGLLNAHVHLAIVGFATLTAVGVGSRLLPMFLISRNHATWPLRWIGPVVGAGLVAFATGQIWRIPALTLAGGLAGAAGLGLYVYQAAEYFRRRTRRRLDPALAHVLAAHAFLAIAIVVGLRLLEHGFHTGLATAYGVLALLGWLTLLVTGVLYKILPFLTWLHRFSPRAGERGLPTVAELTSPRWAWASLALLGAAVPLLAAGVAAAEPATARVGALLFAAGVLVVVAQHVRVALVKRDDRQRRSGWAGAQVRTRSPEPS